MKDLIIVIFGATGDLTSRKLLPAISRLYKNKELPKETIKRDKYHILSH